ncbi:MAG TPA: S41 family peptidase, partial [Bacteroidia bacterium]|nr:S41 family peptidase [Bacteroidia bacterium]
GRGCAGDVAKELIKLQKDGIQALILDLRFNGGGSLTEATDLAGIFIDGGSLWISRNSANERFTIKDPNRGSAYAGPMMVLVNGASASASEFLCSALQDHRRAIIVGSTTFGKATSQAFYPIDPRATDPNGFVKITSHKYYRLQGNSHQFTGVQPDIVLPDPWARFIEGEGTLPWAIQPDTVLKKTYYTPLQLPDLGALQRQSTARCAQNAAFKELDEIAGQLKALLEAQKSLALNGAAWFGWEEQRRKLLSKLDELEKERPDAAFTLHSSQFDAAFLQVDEYSRNLKEEMMQTLRKDLQLGECLHIIEDVLHP